MNIVQVNNCDLMGRRFNGHDLQLSLNKLGHQAHQIVLEKFGNEPTTISLASSHQLFVRSMLRNVEHQLSINNLVYPYGKDLAEHHVFQNADIVHYHLIHNHFLSLYDLPNLTRMKPSVWTVHDPWIVTGHCVHPRECTGWKDGCSQCPQLNDMAFPMQVDKASQMWQIKKQVYQKMNIDIVVASKFMEDYVRNSPLTAHFSHIHKIPFGIDVDYFQRTDKGQARQRLNVHGDSFVIAFRAETNENKGLVYVNEMLEKLNPKIPVTLLVVGYGSLPLHVAERYQVIELGWQNDLQAMADFYAAADLFLMPSLAESFGLMAIEAMASGCPVIVFEETVLQEITFSPECGIAVPYKNSDMLKVAVERLMLNPEEHRWRGNVGIELAKKHYRFEDYVRRHIELYEEILERNRIDRSFL